MSANDIAEHNLLERPSVKLLTTFKSPTQIRELRSKLRKVTVRCEHNTIWMRVNPSLQIFRQINRIEPPTQVPINSEVA